MRSKTVTVTKEMKQSLRQEKDDIFARARQEDRQLTAKEKRRNKEINTLLQRSS